MDAFYWAVDFFLPFQWARYDFMKNALLAVLLLAPALGVLGTAVISHRMAFFSDVIGHSAFAGIAVGLLFGFSDPQWAMVAFAALLALGITAVRRWTQAAPDTVLGVFFAAITALGVALLSRGGGFGRVTAYLIGDILTITPPQLAMLAVLLAVVAAFWLFAGNALALAAMSPSLARSRGVRVFLAEAAFSVLLAVAIAMSLRWVGILIINSLLVLPAASARLMSRSLRAYVLWATGIAWVSGVAGLVLSYYSGTATGATIVLVAACAYGCCAAVGLARRGRRFPT